MITAFSLASIRFQCGDGCHHWPSPMQSPFRIEAASRVTTRLPSHPPTKKMTRRVGIHTGPPVLTRKNLRCVAPGGEGVRADRVFRERIRLLWALVYPVRGVLAVGWLCHAVSGDVTEAHLKMRYGN